MNGRITTGDMAKMFGVTRRAALKQLSKLVELEVIKLEGKGRGHTMFLRKDSCRFSCRFWEHGFNERLHIKLENLR